MLKRFLRSDVFISAFLSIYFGAVLKVVIAAPIPWLSEKSFIIVVSIFGLGSCLSVFFQQVAKSEALNRKS